MPEEFYLKIYLFRPNRVPPIKIARNSQLKITIETMDYTVPVGATASAFAQGSGGNVYTQPCTVDGNRISFIPVPGFFTYGRNSLQYEINNGVIPLAIDVNCALSLPDGGQAAEPEQVLPLVQRAENAAAQSEAAAARAQEVKDSIPEDYTALSDGVNQLNGDLVNFEDKTFNVKRQFLKHGNGTDGFIWLKNESGVKHYAVEGTYAYYPIKLKGGTTYYFINVYDTYTYFVDLGGSYIGQLGTSGSGSYNGNYTPEVDCYAYVSINKSNYNTAFLSDSEKQLTEWEEGIVEAKLKTECLENESITTEKCDFFTSYEQLLKASEKIIGSYWAAWGETLRTEENSNMYRFPKIKLKKDAPYSFIGVMGYYTFFFSLDNNYIAQLSSNTADIDNYEYTPSEDCYAYVSCNTRSTSPMLVNNVNYVPKEYVEGIYQVVLKDIKIESDSVIGGYYEKEITVKTDGSGDYTSVISAVAKANEISSYGYSVTVKIYDGEYDLLNELGGETWLSTIQNTGIFAERQGLRPDKNVNLIGIGRVILKFQLPNTVTYVQSQCTSCLNLYASNKIENIEFIAQNCRYVCHDECNGGNPNLTRYVKNCKFTHLGNANGLWEYPSVMGGGCGGGSSYDWINCQFYGETYSNGFSYHTNSNAKPSHFNIDGCVSKVSNSNGDSFGCHYYGTNHDGNTIFNFKNCTGNGIIRKRAETQDSLDHIKMFVNGYVQTDDI